MSNNGVFTHITVREYTRHRIQLCVIAPKHDPFAALGGDMIFLQADWCDALTGRTLDYFNGLRGTKPLILDNQHPVGFGRTEGVVDLQKLMDTAYRLHASEIIIPDVLNSAAHTLDSLHRFFDTVPLEQYTKFSLMFVPQGNNIDEWVACYNSFWRSNHARDIQTIGIPKWLGEDRWQALGFVNGSYKIHFLGVKSGWGELEYYPRIRSWDTSLMYAFAQRRLLMHSMSRDMKVLLNDEVLYLNDLDLLESNIQFVRELLQEERVRDEY